MAEETAPTNPAQQPYLPYSQSLALGLATLWLVYLCALIIKPFFTVLAWALALAVATHPLSTWLQREIKSSSLASFIALFTAALVICIPSIWISRLLIEASIENIASVIERPHLQLWLDPATAPPSIAPLLAWLDQTFHLQQLITEFGHTMAQRLPSVVSMSVIGIVQFLLILFTTFFFIRDGNLFLSYLTWAVPLPVQETERAVLRVVDTVHACLFGIVLMAILQGTLGAFIFWWLELPQPLLWGVVMGLLAVVPYLGAFIVWIPTATVLAMQGAWGDALVLTLWGGVVIGLADNLLYPILVGKRLHYHTLLIFFFLFGGVLAFGSAGVVIGPVILSVTHGVIALWQHEDN